MFKGCLLSPIYVLSSLKNPLHSSLVVLLIDLHRLFYDSYLLQKLLLLSFHLLVLSFCDDLLVVCKVDIVHFLGHFHHLGLFVC